MDEKCSGKEDTGAPVDGYDCTDEIGMTEDG